MHLRRGNVVKRHIPENNIIAGIKNGKLVATDEISFNGREWDPLGEHPSFCIFFSKDKQKFLKKKEVIQTENKAGWFRRLFAFFVDFLIAYWLYKAIKFFILSAGWVVDDIHSFLLILSAIIYFSILETGITKGKTVGRFIMSLRVVDKSGDPLSIWSSFLRASFFLTSMGMLTGTPDIKDSLNKFILIPEPYVPAFCFVIFCIFYVGNLFFILFHPQRRGLHDIISSSYLVYGKFKKTTLHNFSNGSIVAGVISSISFGIVVGIYLSSTSYFVNQNPAQNFSKKVEDGKQYHLNRMQAKDWPGWKDIHRAVARGDLKEVTNLIDKGEEVDARGEDGTTPLYEASRRGNLAMMNYLISKGADLNAKENNGFSSLQITAEYHQLEAMRLLIKSGADVNSRDNYNRTPLIQAAQQRWHSDGLIAEILVDAGADMTLRSYDQCIPIYCAITSKNLQFVEALLKRGADPNTKKKEWSILQYAVWKEDYQMVELILKYKPDLNYKMPTKGNTALIIAMENEYFEIAKLILKHNPNVHTIRSDKKSAMWFAERHKNKELIEELKKRGAISYKD